MIVLLLVRRPWRSMRYAGTPPPGGWGHEEA